MKRFLIFLLVTSSVLTVVKGGAPWVEEPRDIDWWKNAHNFFVYVTKTYYAYIKVLFYGDSLTQGWAGEGNQTFQEYYQPLGTVNYGIGGDRTEHVLWRIKNEEVTDQLNPKVCVIRIGANNILSNDPTSIALGITRNVMELRERLPNMKVLLLGMLPALNEAVSNRMKEVNNIIQHLENGKTIRYLDMFDHFYDGGKLRTELYVSDMVHLSADGYRKWAEVMNPLFMELYGSK